MLAVLGSLVFLAAVALSMMVTWRVSQTALVLLGLGMALGTRITLSGINFDVVELVLISMLAILIVFNFHRLFIPLQSYEIIFIVFLGFRLTMSIFAADLRHSFSDLREWLEFVIALMVLRRVLVTAELANVARKAFLFGAVISATLALGQAYWDWPAPFVSEQGQMKTFVDFGSQSNYRVQPVAGLQSHPNSFAIYLAVGAIMLLFWTESFGTRKWLVLSWCGAGLCLWAIATTFAKTTYVAMGLTLLSVPCLRFWRGSLWRTCMLLAGGFGIIFMALRSAEIEGYGFALSSFYIRERLWQDSLIILARNWHGLFLGDQLSELWKISVWGQPHNTFLFFLLEYGIIGACLLIAGGWAIVREVSRSTGTALGRSSVSARTKLICALVLYLGWTGMFESVGYPVHDKILLALTAAFLLSEAGASRKDSRNALSE
jgi:hypothetical protein